MAKIAQIAMDRMANGTVAIAYSISVAMVGVRRRS